MSNAVQNMFQDIASRYDLANDVLSLGTHRLWRKTAVQFSGIKPGMKVLDLCCGTGDFSSASARIVGTSGSVMGMDFAPEMVELAKKKYPKIQFIVGDALTIPFADRSFDAVTVAFGIRNVDDHLHCLREINRVLLPGGIAVVLEFGRPFIPGWRLVYDAYSRHLMPAIGAILTCNRQAYEYLPRTARTFPSGEEFLALMTEGGFTKARMKPLFGGIAYVYVGHRRNGSTIPAEEQNVH